MLILLPKLFDVILEHFHQFIDVAKKYNFPTKNRKAGSSTAIVKLCIGLAKIDDAREFFVSNMLECFNCRNFYDERN